MSFEEKLNSQFDTFVLKPPYEFPQKLKKIDIPNHKVYLYVDYIELIALFSNGSYITKDGLLDRIQDEGVLELEDTEESVSEAGSDIAEQQDEREVWIESIFKVLEERTLLFAENYPFKYLDNKLRIKDTLTFKQELYIMLLVASNLNLFKKVQTQLTSEFELISFYVLKNFLPAQAIVKNFGCHSEYSGNTKAKISALSEDLNLKIKEDAINQIPNENVQDGGLDVIGWIPFADKNPNFLTLLGQCTCGKGWDKKIRETEGFESCVDFYKLKPIHCMFIPYSIIEVSKGFYQSLKITNTLIFERKRIVELFEEKELFNSFDSKKIVDRAIEFEEGVV